MAFKIKDVAEVLGISQATVSLVLNNKPGISDETRQKVMKTAEELGYDISSIAKAETKNIRFIVYKKHGKVVGDTPFFSELIESIDQEARKNGYNLVISYINEKDNKSEIESIVSDNPQVGIIILATEMTEDDIKQFMKMKLPILVLDSYFEKIKADTVIINNVQGAYEATQYLIDMGHSKIGYIQSSTKIKNFQEREEGFVKALIQNGIKLNKEDFISVQSTMEGSYMDMIEILETWQKPTTAFFADNDIIAFGAIKALKEKGYRVPEDISIIGFDDLPFSVMIEPTLTTIKVNRKSMGGIAVRRLLEIVKGDTDEFVKIEIGTDLVHRKSVLKREEGANK